MHDLLEHRGRVGHRELQVLGRILVHERDRSLPGVGLDQRHVALGQVLGDGGDHVRVRTHQHRLGTGSVLGLRHQVPRQVLGGGRAVGTG